MSNVKSILCGILALALMLGGCAGTSSELAPAPAPVSSSSVNEASELELERLKAEKERKEAEAEEKANAESLEWKQAYYDYIIEYLSSAKRYDPSNPQSSVGYEYDASINAISLVDIYGEGTPALFLWCTHAEYNGSLNPTLYAFCKYWENGELIDSPFHERDGFYFGEDYYFNPESGESVVSYRIPRSESVVAVYKDGKWNNIYSYADNPQGAFPHTFISNGERTDFYPKSAYDNIPAGYPDAPILDEAVVTKPMLNYLENCDSIDLKEYMVNFPEVEKEGYVDWEEAAPTIAALFNSFDDRDNFEAVNVVEENNEILKIKWSGAYIDFIKEEAEMISTRDSDGFYNYSPSPISYLYLMDIDFDGSPELIVSSLSTFGPSFTSFTIYSHRRLPLNRTDERNWISCNKLPSKFFKNNATDSIVFVDAYNSEPEDGGYIAFINASKFERNSFSCSYPIHDPEGETVYYEAHSLNNNDLEIHRDTGHPIGACKFNDNINDDFGSHTATVTKWIAEIIDGYVEIPAPEYYEFNTGFTYENTYGNPDGNDSWGKKPVPFLEQPIIDWIQEVADNW